MDMGGGGNIVLVGVIKDRRDLALLLHQKWYRIPVGSAPKQPFTHLAFYQPSIFGRQGKCIRYYARVREIKAALRSELLDEPDHPRAGERYMKVNVGSVMRLPRLVRNIVPRRVTFGFTTLHHLRNARDMLQLFDVVPIEQMVEDALRQLNMKVISQHTVTCDGKRFRLDFAIIHKDGKIAIECDNVSSHTSPTQKMNDKKKDRALQACGWTVIRLTEKQIIDDLPSCMMQIENYLH